MPAALTRIETEAFYNDRSYSAIIVPRGVTGIGSAALGCYRGGMSLYVYDSAVFIIYYLVSTAEAYANAHNVLFVSI